MNQQTQTEQTRIWRIKELDIILTMRAIDHDSSLADAAINSGFCDQSHLNNRFKSAFGLTPKQYQHAVGS